MSSPISRRFNNLFGKTGTWWLLDVSWVDPNTFALGTGSPLCSHSLLHGICPQRRYLGQGLNARTCLYFPRQQGGWYRGHRLSALHQNSIHHKNGNCWLLAWSNTEFFSIHLIYYRIMFLGYGAAKTRFRESYCRIPGCERHVFSFLEYAYFISTLLKLHTQIMWDHLS